MACPGWCKTGMGGEKAVDGPEVGAESILRSAFIGQKDKPTGKFMRFGRIIPIDVYPPAIVPPKRSSRIVNSFLAIKKLINLKMKGL